MSELTLVPGVGDPTDEVAQLEAEIVLKRARLAGSLDELRHQWHDVTSWRHWIVARPAVWLGVGLCLGFVVGYGARSGRRRR